MIYSQLTLTAGARAPGCPFSPLRYGKMQVIIND